MSDVLAFDDQPALRKASTAATETAARQAQSARLLSMVCCPRCRSDLRFTASNTHCQNFKCHYASEGFPNTCGQMVLIDFENSVFRRGAYQDSSGSVFVRDDSGNGLRNRFRHFVTGSNKAAAKNCVTMIKRLKSLVARPKILIIGGGAIGSGVKQLYDDPDIEVTGIDVYGSCNTKLIADAHRLPFKAESFDGVWIQAVLEHVLEPWMVAEEIHRVLKPAGIVYADTPFMQQVHEEAYDFTRFTRSGHRWLFRKFEQIDAGTVGGAGTAFVWSIRYLARALGAPNKLATLITLPFFWVRFLDHFTQQRTNSDAASGVYFLGCKTAKPLSYQQITAYYYES